MRKCRADRVALAMVLLAFLGGAEARATEASSKRELVIELFRATGGADMAQKVTAILLSSMRQSYSSMVDEMIAAQPSLTLEQRQAIEQRLANFDRFAERFSARVAQQVDFEGILEQAYVPLYERYFTEAELRQMLEFQTSPVGRKAAALVPRLIQEGMAATMQVIQPAILSIAGEILRDEQAIALREVR